jgi:uncharacterized protein (TIGR03435 family)
MTRLLLVGAALAVCTFSQDAPSPPFEVVSIKPTPDPPIRTGMFPTPGTLTVNNYSLKRLILETRRIKNYQLSGGPPWIDSDHYDIVGKASGKASFSELLKMLIPMMEDRFQLKFHRETRDLPVYALTLAKGGSKMQPATDASKSFGIYPSEAITEIKAFRLDMRSFANILSGQLDRLVTNETGLAGEFQFNLRYVSDLLAKQPDNAEAPSDPNAASIFAALQEQLGLKLDARKAPIEVIVIDHAERPAAN